MNATLVSALTQLDCSMREIKFFVACYSLGPSTLSEIASRAHLQRSTAYVIAESLVAKRLINHDHREYAKRYIALSPQALLRQLETKQRRISRMSMTMQKELSELESQYKASNVLPKVLVYQGIKGLVTIKNEILTSKDEILLWSNQETEQHIFNEKQHQAFVDIRLRRKIPIRVLAVDNKKGRTLIPTATDQLRNTRYLPTGTSFSPETYLYDSTIAILDFNTDIVGIIIHNQAMYQAQKAMFELAWEKSA